MTLQKREKTQWRSRRKVDAVKGDDVKVDAAKVNGLPGGGLFDIGVYTFPNHAETLFMP
jgi:hypothetical protein